MGERSELREIQKLEGHTDKVWSLAWNPVAGINGTPAILASCGNDNTVLIWMQNLITSTFDCLVPPHSSPSLFTHTHTHYHGGVK